MGTRPFTLTENGDGGVIFRGVVAGRKRLWVGTHFEINSMVAAANRGEDALAAWTACHRSFANTEEVRP